MNFDDLIDQLIGGGYYYQPQRRSVQRPVRRVQRRVPTTDYDQLVREYLLRQYLAEQQQQEEQPEEPTEPTESEEKQQPEDFDIVYEEAIEGTVPKVPVDNAENDIINKDETGGKEANEPVTANEIANGNENASPSPSSSPIQVSSPADSSPLLNLYEFDKHYVILLSLPGMDKTQLDINFHTQSNELVISGESIDPYLTGDVVSDSQLTKINEFKFGKFKRHIKLPHALGQEPEISARFNNGLLEIKVTKEGDVKHSVRKISIEEVPDEEFNNGNE